MIQRRLQKARRHDPPNKAKIFATLAMEGPIYSTLHFLSDDGGGGVVPLKYDVITQLHDKHPAAKKAKLGSLLFGPMQNIPDFFISRKRWRNDKGSRSTTD